MSDIKIKLQSVSKVFETEEMQTHALNNINLEISAGDYVSISGPSGSGKSTLLSILGLLDTPTSGKYFIDGKDVSGLSLNESAKVRSEKIGYVFQSFNLIEELTVFENVALPLRYQRDKISEDKIAKRVMQCIEMVSMVDRANHNPNQLSGGQQQRVAIARAIVADPVILLIDEPTGNLDSKNSDQIFALLTQLNGNGTAILLVTHDSRYAQLAKSHFNLLDGSLHRNN